MNIKDYKLHQQFYLYGSILSYSVFLLTLTGIVTFAPTHILLLQKILKYYVCLFLIIRFNPFNHIRNITKRDVEFDRKIAFSAGIFLLLTTALTEIMYKLLDNVYTFI